MRHTLIKVLPLVLMAFLSLRSIAANDEERCRSLILSEEEKIRFEEEFRASLQEQANQTSRRRLAARINIDPKEHPEYFDYTQEPIPLEEGVSPSGARTYQLPIQPAPGFKLVPSIALVYNSQGGDGWAGYGWDIQGISSITLINKNQYYHGEAKAASIYDKESVFALDGTPLVTNANSETNAEYPLETATGHILVAPEKNSKGFISKFKVLYPNGMRATFGHDKEKNGNYIYYPVKEMRDMDGNRMTFVYDGNSINGIPRPTSIRYGYNSRGQYAGEIVFEYSTRKNITQYYAGETIERAYLLTGIISKNDGELLYRYRFTHEKRDYVDLLTSIVCDTIGERFSPVVFTYGDDEGSTSKTLITKENPIMLERAYTNEDTEYYYKRGKFVSNSFNDGLLIYPSFPNYGVLSTDLGYQYWTMYRSDIKVLLAPSLSDWGDVNTSISVGVGFQTIEPVDVDGDGLDEIVQVNFKGTSGNNTILSITVYKVSNSGIPAISSSFDIQVKGIIKSGERTSPVRLSYHWGDFNGDGKVQLLIVAYDKNYNEMKYFDQTSYATLIDIDGKKKQFERELFKYPIEKSGCLIVSDIDNDTKAELCFARPYGFEIYRLNPYNAFVKDRTLDTPPESAFTQQYNPYYITDINGDGYIDILVAPNRGELNWPCYSYDGTKFSYSTVPVKAKAGNGVYMFMDINRDGLPDALELDGKKISVSINYYGRHFSYDWQSPYYAENTKGIVPANVVDFRNASSFIKVDGSYVHEFLYTNLSPEIRQIKRSEDCFGRVDNIYTYLPKVSRAMTDNSVTVETSSGYVKKTLPLYVLSNERAYSSDGDQSLNRSYSYYGGVINNRGLGFCGFSRIRTDENTGGRGFVTDEYHDPTRRGIITRSASRNGSFEYSKTENTYDDNRTTYGKENPRLVKSVTTDVLTGIETTTSYTYDQYDFPTRILESRRIGAGNEQTETRVKTYRHSNTASKYILGLVTEESVLKEGDGNDRDVWKEKTVISYSDNGHPMTSRHYVGQSTLSSVNKTSSASLLRYDPWTEEIIDIEDPDPPLEPDEPGEPEDPIEPDVPEPDEPEPEMSFADVSNLVSETHWEYDGHGNLISEKTAPYGSTEFIGNTNTYDADGRYLISETDALGRTTTYGEYNIFGQPKTSIDYLGHITRYTYNYLGYLVKTEYADGSVEETHRDWSHNVSLYYVTSTSTGKPETKSYYDALGREVRSGVKRFDGQWQWVDKEYDARGRLSRISLPFRGEDATHWNTYKYDDYDRPVELKEASGKVSTWSYSGTSVTTTKDGITSTSTTDANGNVISITDAGGTITYKLRDDGQPSSVTAPGDVVTKFTYDDYGRKTKINDPSAGIQTEEYVWNSDGSSQTTHTNPNGQIVTYKDKYGRTTLVERPGEYNTTYTYDDDGRIVSEQSTNGTGLEYTYDEFDRVATTKETVPDGKWLKKSYTYAPGGIVTSAKYTAQSGDIITETYTYSNGHNTDIVLPNGTPVWSLVSENDLGAATEIISGGINREYGFTDFGLPTFRRMDDGHLQDFSYEFDPMTGNLGRREDIVNNQAENFGYDNLNRLISIGVRQISYAQNGNIVSMAGVGTMSYGNSERPYQITTLYPEEDGLVPNRRQSVSYTCYSRPSILVEGERSAAFTYNGAGDRVKMYVANGAAQVLTRYYIGARYECDQTPSGIKERLYLGGDAYSAPMVYEREDSGDWGLYNIGRDYLGNITHIATADGNLVAEYSYDPWGRLRNPETLEIYAPGTEPELFLGRGYTGHEHLTWFGLINMNARLYDPLLGRFLSPDPYVQAPDFTQNFNRYSYALNNPLKYTDETGEFFITGAMLIAMGIGAICNVALNVHHIDNGWEFLGLLGAGAASGLLASVTGGSSLLVQGGSALVGGAISSVASNAVEQYGNGQRFDWGKLGRAAISGAITGTITAGTNKLINGKWISKALDKLKVENSLCRNIIGNTIEGAEMGAVSGIVYGIGAEFIDKGFKGSWSLERMTNGLIFGAAIGGGMGVLNGVIQERDYQKRLKTEQGIADDLPSSSFVGEQMDNVASNLTSSKVGGSWNFGHNYANVRINLPQSICIGIQTGRCTINIDPYSKMVPTQPTYYVPKF